MTQQIMPVSRVPKTRNQTGIRINVFVLVDITMTALDNVSLIVELMNSTLKLTNPVFVALASST